MSTEKSSCEWPKCKWWDGKVCQDPIDYRNSDGDYVCGRQDDAIPVLPAPLAPLREVYEKYKDLALVLENRDLLIRDKSGQVLYDLWQAIKENARLHQRRKIMCDQCDPERMGTQKKEEEVDSTEAIKTAIGEIPFGEIKAAHIISESSTHFEVEVIWIVQVPKAPTATAEDILEPRKKKNRNTSAPV